MRTLPIANPESRFAVTVAEYFDGEVPNADLRVVEDASREILSHNTSPDVGFSWSINPYRGCMHACAYCYARPTHEYLSLGAGTDFDRTIVVKMRAAELLREAFDRAKWKGDVVVFSGVTDCYQPLEAQLRLTRGCLEVCAEYNNPIGIITKSALVERDIDVLATLVKNASARVHVSVPFADAALARAIEPYAPSPERRFHAIERLARAGIPVGVAVAPIIPGLNDADIPKVLARAKDAGATSAFWVLLRLPGAVREVFETRLRDALPLRAEKVLRRVRETRSGSMYNAQFGVRGRGEGEYAELIGRLFDTTATRLGLDHHREEKDGAPVVYRAGRATERDTSDRESDHEKTGAKESTFRRPKGQMTLF